MPESRGADRVIGAEGIALRTLTLLLCSFPALALDPSLDISQYAHTAWTFRNGFLNGTVYAFAQTPDGYLWLGTQSGIVRFDGVRALPLPLPPGQQLPSTSVGALLTARDGTLWIGTLGGLVSWKNGQLTTYPALAQQSVIALFERRDGTVWAGGFGSPTGKLCAIRGGSTNCYGDDGSLGAVVASLHEDAAGNLWVAAGTGLWRWNPGPPTRYLSERIPSFQGFAQGDHGSGVVVAVDSVRQIVGQKLVDYPLHGVPSPLTAAHVLRDRNGGLWIGTNAHGLVHSFEGETSIFTHSDGMSSDRVVALFEDREGTIWVATPDGLDQFRESPVGSLSQREGLSSAIAMSILAARDGSVWIGTADGLNRWKDGRATIYRKRSDPGLPDHAIQSLFEDERGRIWVTGFRGVSVFENGRFAAVPSLPMGTTHAMASDNHDGLWLSMWLAPNGYDLVHLREGKIIEHAPWKSLGGGPGSGLVADPDGGVWTGLLSGGIAYFRTGQIRSLPLSGDGTAAPRVLNLSRDRDGALWAATENSLSRIANRRVASLTTANGLPCNAVHWIIEDNRSSYWLYTRCGLLRIARTELDAWIADPKRKIRVTTFDTSDGIRPVGILRGFRPSVTKSSDGKIWFLNGDTASFIDPSHIDINTLPPPVHIEQIAADGKAYDAKDGLRLPPHVRNLVIDYTALSLVAPQKVHFRFRLDGQDLDWREVINEREVQYSNLAPGNYRFRVIASNNSGVWNETGDTLEFSIAHAYYQTNWFRAFVAATVLALLWAAYRFRIGQLERVRQLEADLAHINRVSMMGELAASIAHEVNQPLSGIVSNGSACLRWLAGDPPNLEEVREAVGDIVRDGKRAGEVIARIRALTKRTSPPAEKLDVNETIREVLALVGDEAKRKSVVIRTQFADDLSPVSGDRVQLQQVVLNLVMNSMEAMSSLGERARQVVISTRNIDPDQVEVTVEDSGVGLDPNTMARIFDPFYTTKPGGMGMGLSISRSILQNHGGRLWATPNNGLGTSFHFALPKYHDGAKYAGVARV
jgi:signal transduction histidine kinase/ligand-binding sensor domain-containing protein